MVEALVDRGRGRVDVPTTIRGSEPIEVAEPGGDRVERSGCICHGRVVVEHKGIDPLQASCRAPVVPLPQGEAVLDRHPVSGVEGLSHRHGVAPHEHRGQRCGQDVAPVGEKQAGAGVLPHQWSRTRIGGGHDVRWRSPDIVHVRHATEFGWSIPAAAHFGQEFVVEECSRQALPVLGIAFFPIRAISGVDTLQAHSDQGAGDGGGAASVGADHHDPRAFGHGGRGGHSVHRGQRSQPKTRSKTRLRPGVL